jgi:hypothetical protein
MMEEKNRKNRNEERSAADDPMTTREVIREVQGDRDTNLNDLKDTDQAGSSRERGTGAFGTDRTKGMDYTPNDTSGVRSGGISDMDDQAAGGAGHNSGSRHGMGSDLHPKKGVTGSDFDGQNPTS